MLSPSPDSVNYLGWQILGMLIIIAWTLLFSIPYFLIMKKLGLLRVPLVYEIIGLDVAEMGSKAHVENLISASIQQA